jgi:hypothetical protein
MQDAQKAGARRKDRNIFCNFLGIINNEVNVLEMEAGKTG